MINPQLKYTDGGRSGTMHYSSDESSFDMWYELAAGSAVAFIKIPSINFWEAQTKIPVYQRQAVIGFIGNEVVKNKLNNDGYFLLDDNFIMLYSGKNPDS